MFAKDLAAGQPHDAVQDSKGAPLTIVLARVITATLLMFMIVGMIALFWLQHPR